MKFIKYIGIILAIIVMFYAKNQMDTRNKTEKESLDQIDQSEGLSNSPPNKNKE